MFGSADLVEMNLIKDFYFYYALFIFMVNMLRMFLWKKKKVL